TGLGRTLASQGRLDEAEYRFSRIEQFVVPNTSRLRNERVFNKISASAFGSTPIELVLHKYGIDTLFFTGVSTNMCVEHTLRDASDRGFQCILVEDACGAGSPEMYETTVAVVPRLYGTVMSTDEVIERIEAPVAASVS